MRLTSAGPAGRGKKAGAVPSLCFVSLWTHFQRLRSLGDTQLCATSLIHKKEHHVVFSHGPLTCEGHWPWIKEDDMGKEQGSDTLGAERRLVGRKQPGLELPGI